MERHERQLPPLCIHQAFELQADRAPAGIAAILSEQRVTYAELNGEANQVARRLHEQGVAPEVLVGVCMQPGRSGWPRCWASGRRAAATCRWTRPCPPTACAS